MTISHPAVGNTIPVVALKQLFKPNVGFDTNTKYLSKGRSEGGDIGRPMVIGGIYREFHHLLQPQPNNSNEPRLQLERWRRTIAGWKKAMQNSRCVVFGYFNLDHQKWADLDYRNAKMVKVVIGGDGDIWILST